ncbi:uncharacterized protein LOC118645914 [Monomorium pharaonis]|uniref:uncharacterized protein LOC118645914 n=1 Tax=Monomorium pharaonis TaxID=307658 RepID=UPI0017468135|nr:uncharacterized protein LOC118645914 [Monomorium pharaonis]
MPVFGHLSASRACLWADRRNPVILPVPDANLSRHLSASIACLWAVVEIKTYFAARLTSSRDFPYFHVSFPRCLSLGIYPRREPVSGRIVAILLSFPFSMPVFGHLSASIACLWAVVETKTYFAARLTSSRDLVTCFSTPPHFSSLRRVSLGI